MVERQPGRTAQLREKFEAKYGALIPYFQTWAKGRPENGDPADELLFGLSARFATMVLEANPRLFRILYSLSIPISTRLDWQRSHDEKSCPNPTNDKQIRRAIKATKEAMDSLCLDLEFDMLQDVAEGGGLSETEVSQEWSDRFDELHERRRQLIDLLSESGRLKFKAVNKHGH